MDLQSVSELLGNFGEFFGAIAVVATLGYLVVQIRQNTVSTNSNNNHSVMGAFNSFNETLFSDSELIRIYYDGISSPASMTEGDLRRFIHMLACLMNIYRNLYNQYLDGTFPEDQWIVQAREARQLMETPGGVHFRTISASYESLYRYLADLPQGELVPLSTSLFPLPDNTDPE